MKNVHVLAKFGFEKVLSKTSIKKEQDNTFDCLISIVKPIDHVNPQFVFKISREMLDILKWDITDRVIMLVNKENGVLALSKTTLKDRDSFAISAQGMTVSVAKERKVGGIVKIGWKENITDKVPQNGSFDTKAEIFENTLLFKLPSKMFN
jgi:hypothetical protein